MDHRENRRANGHLDPSVVSTKEALLGPREGSQQSFTKEVSLSLDMKGRGERGSHGVVLQSRHEHGGRCETRTG